MTSDPFTPLTAEQLKSAHALWEEMASFPAADSDSALLHLMTKIAASIGADDVIWVGAVRVANRAASRRDPLLGWRGMAVRHLNSHPRILQRSAEAARQQDSAPGLTTRALVERTGDFRVNRLRDGFVDFARFRSTKHYRLFYEEMDMTLSDTSTIDTNGLGATLSGEHGRSSSRRPHASFSHPQVQTQQTRQRLSSIVIGDQRH